MEVPDWLMKPTKNNRQHITIMSLIEHVQKAAERRGIDPFLEKQIQKLERVHLDHARETADLDEGVIGDVKNAVFEHKLRVVTIGLLLTLGIVGPYFVITRTSWLSQRPILCKEFPTQDSRHPHKLEVCINGVTHAYSPQNGDVELDIAFRLSESEQVQADTTFWIADKLADREVDYEGEYNTSRVRIYANGILVSDDRTKVSSWINPLFPEDMRTSVWKWVRDNQNTYSHDRPPLEEKLSRFVDSVGAVFAALGSMGVAVYRFMRVKG